MADARLNVILSAEAKQLQATMKKAGAAVQSLQSETQKLPAAFAKVDASANKSAATLKRVSASAAEAGSRMANSFRSIANIIPGIGIAGLVGGLAGLVGGLFKTSTAAKELGARLKELIKPIAEIKDQAGAQEELAKVTALSNAVLDQTKSYNQRNNALNQLKKINQSYFGDLTLETSKLGILKDRVDEYSKAIVNAAVIKAFSDEIGKIAVELSKQERAFNDAGKAIVDQNKQLLINQKLISAGDNAAKQQTAGLVQRVTIATGKLKDQGKVVGKLRDQMFLLRQSIQEAVNASLDFRSLDVIKTETPAIKLAKENLQPRVLIENLVLVKSQNYFASLKLEAGKMLEDLQDEITKLTKRNPIILAAERIQAEQKARGAELTSALGLNIEGVNAPISLLTKLQKEAVNAANTINGVLSPAFDNLFQAIRAGANPIKGFFEGLMQSVTALIQKLISAIATALILNAIFPGLGGEQGAFGIFKSLMGFKAQGGPVFAGKPYIVGEDGAEMFIPGRNGQIVSNKQMMSGLEGITGPAMGFVAQTQIRGRDLLLVVSRQGGYNKRNT